MLDQVRWRTGAAGDDSSLAEIGGKRHGLAPAIGAACRRLLLNCNDWAERNHHANLTAGEAKPKWFVRPESRGPWR
jgi:hypothetical protein